MSRLKVVTVIGTRPELIRLSATIGELDNHYDHILVHTGQNFDYELNGIFYEDLGVRRPDYFLEVAGETTAITISNIISQTDSLLARESPDAFLVLGDTNSCLSAISAKKRQIPIFHMEAGNRCFDLRVPEETNRKIVDHLADINMTYSSIAREYLLREGLQADRVIKIGSPMMEVLTKHGDRIQKSTVLDELKITAKNYYVVSSHREENIGPAHMFHQLIDILNRLAEEKDKPVIVTTHPKLRNRIREGKCIIDKRVRMIKPLCFTDYIKLQMESSAVLSDSGTITEESSILKFNALNLRESHERPEGMEEAAVMMVGLNYERIAQGLEILSSQANAEANNINVVPDYNVSNVSIKVARIIQSYVDYTNRVVWQKKD